MEDLAFKINEAIQNSVEYKEYIRLKNRVEKDNDLVLKKEELEKIKKDICSNRNQELLDVYYQKEQEYKNNYIVKDYLRSQEILKELFKEIVDILSVN